MSAQVPTQDEANGHAKPRSEVRTEVLELNSKRTQIENEIKEYQAILRTVCLSRCFVW